MRARSRNADLCESDSRATDKGAPARKLRRRRSSGALLVSRPDVSDPTEREPAPVVCEMTERVEIERAVERDDTRRLDAPGRLGSLRAEIVDLDDLVFGHRRPEPPQVLGRLNLDLDVALAKG